MYNSEDRIYKPTIQVRDLTDNEVKFINRGVRCKLERIDIEPQEIFAIIQDNMGRNLKIPFALFEKIFEPSIDQISKIN